MFKLFRNIDKKNYRPVFGGLEIFKFIGPGLLVTVGFIDPGNWASELAAGAEYGVRKYSALGWYDARTPMPDNYRYLPGYTGDRETELAWWSNDARYTQVCWDELFARNRMAGGHAAVPATGSEGVLSS